MSTPPLIAEASRPKTRRSRSNQPLPLRSRITRRGRRICSYEDHLGAGHELVARPGAEGSLLVVDRRAGSTKGERLLAHLHSDEPFENAVLVCRGYLEQRPSRRGCRGVTEEDERRSPMAAVIQVPATGGPKLVAGPNADFRLESTLSRTAASQLRWSRHPKGGEASPRAISLREAIGEVESYEPFCSISAAALELHSSDPMVSITTLRAELQRVRESSIVLNRALREAVLASMRRDGLSMSEIAIRCGRVKRDSHGNESGETSWLARRLGLLAEGGKARLTPWIHSEVLGLIARRGIGVSPREVELS